MKPKIGIYRLFSSFLHPRNLEKLNLDPNKTYTPEEIKKAYIKLAKQFHPDVNKEKHAEKYFSGILNAYRELINQLENPKKQTENNYKSQANEPPPKNQYGMNDDEYAEFQAHKRQTENNRKLEKEFDPKNTDQMMRIAGYIFIIITSNIVLYFLLKINPNHKRGEIKTIVAVDKRTERLKGVKELTLDETFQYSLEELFEMERMKIAKMPDGFYADVMRKYSFANPKSD